MEGHASDCNERAPARHTDTVFGVRCPLDHTTLFGNAPSSAASKPATAKQQTRPKARAISAKGAILMYQDGVTVQFQKKCTECGYLDPSKSSMPIKPGTSRATFFCRKLRHIEIQGIA